MDEKNVLLNITLGPEMRVSTRLSKVWNYEKSIIPASKMS